MKRTLVQTQKFSRVLDALINEKKLLEKDFEAFEKRLVENPEEGDPIQGTGGLRKTRLKSCSKGKSGGFRVCYCDIPEKEKLFFIALYAKNVQEDLNSEEKRQLRILVERLRRE